MFSEVERHFLFHEAFPNVTSSDSYIFFRLSQGNLRRKLHNRVRDYVALELSISEGSGNFSMDIKEHTWAQKHTSLTSCYKSISDYNHDIIIYGFIATRTLNNYKMMKLLQRFKKNTVSVHV